MSRTERKDAEASCSKGLIETMYPRELPSAKGAR